VASKSPDNQTSDRDAAGRSDDGVEPVTPEIGSFEWEELAPHEATMPTNHGGPSRQG
jgi:hypothetical protein